MDNDFVIIKNLIKKSKKKGNFQTILIYYGFNI